MGSGKTPVQWQMAAFKLVLEGETGRDRRRYFPELSDPPTSKSPQEDRKRLWGHSMARNVHEVDPSAQRMHLLLLQAPTRLSLQKAEEWPSMTTCWWQRPLLFFLLFPEFPSSTHWLPWRWALHVLPTDTFPHPCLLVELSKYFYLNRRVTGGTPLSVTIGENIGGFSLSMLIRLGFIGGRTLHAPWFSSIPSLLWIPTPNL